MSYIVRVMKNRQLNGERQKELDTTLSKNILFYLIKYSEKSWKKMG